jgi:hypothetical protein
VMDEHRMLSAPGDVGEVVVLGGAGTRHLWERILRDPKFVWEGKTRVTA